MPFPRCNRGPLAAALVLMPAATAVGAEVPEECRFEADAPKGAAATMACYAALNTDDASGLSAAEAGVLPRLRGRFAELDADASGALSPDEFQAGLHTPAQRGGGKGI
jgi:hypothetical protein